LQLNGYMIAKPTVLARISHEELEHLFRGYGYTPYFVEGHEPERMHQLMAGTLDTVIAEFERIQTGARQKGSAERPRWPMIVLRSPKAWTCRRQAHRDSWRAHQGPWSRCTREGRGCARLPAPDANCLDSFFPGLDRFVKGDAPALRRSPGRDLLLRPWCSPPREIAEGGSGRQATRAVDLFGGGDVYTFYDPNATLSR
jgi:XFP N-terminal domain